MNDIDFDELDKAVNSLASNAPADQPTENTVSQNTITNPSPAARRGNGQFMDMVKPSSNNRSSVVIPERNNGSANSQMPAMQSSAPIVENASDNVVSSTTQDSPVIPENPVVSPFISDAKVEKRPLGAFSNTDIPSVSPSALESNSEMPKPISSDNTIAPTTPAMDQTMNMGMPGDSNAESMPAELQQDVLDVESKGSIDTSYASNPVIADIPQADPIDQPKVTSTITPENEDNNIATASINQQYQEKPSTTEQKTEAMYGGEAYQNGLVKPPKKKSSLFVIIWIIGLLVVGAGAGAAVYFFVLPN